jgi:hypothetical protein
LNRVSERLLVWLVRSMALLLALDSLRRAVAMALA